MREHDGHEYPKPPGETLRTGAAVEPAKHPDGVIVSQREWDEAVRLLDQARWMSQAMSTVVVGVAAKLGAPDFPANGDREAVTAWIQDVARLLGAALNDRAKK